VRDLRAASVPRRRSKTIPQRGIATGAKLPASAQAGIFEQITQVEVIEKDAFRIAVTTTQFAATSLNLLITFDTNDQISVFFVQPVPVEWSPPHYADTGKFTERDLVIGQGDWSFPATLTLPNNADLALPADITLHGLLLTCSLPTRCSKKAWRIL
jgi:hypothetical protein